MDFLIFLVGLVFAIVCVVIIVLLTKSNEKFTQSYLLELKTTLAIPCIAEDIPKLDTLFKSIQDQTIPPTEIIIGLSGVSSFETEKLKKHLQTLTDTPVVVLGTESDASAGINRNRAARESKGDYIIFIDADDLMHPQRIEVILKVFKEKDPIAIVHGYAKDISELPNIVKKPTIRNGKFLYDIHLANPPKDNTHIGLPYKLHHGHISTKRKVFQDGLEYSPRRRGQDAEFLRKLLDSYSYLGDQNVNYIDAPLSVYHRRIPIENHNTIKNILKDSYVITLNANNLEFGKKNIIENRIAQLEDTFQYYELPYRIFYGLYYDGKDNNLSNESIAYIKKNMPWIKLNRLENNGEIGLTGSYFKLLLDTYKSIDNYLMVYEDDALPVGTKEDFWKTMNNAISKLPEKFNKQYPGVYTFAYTNYCKRRCPNKNTWTNGYVKFKVGTSAGAHSVLFTKYALDKILKYTQERGVHLPIDKYLQFLHDKQIIRMHTWEGEESNGGMFCGLFTQNETFCNKRNSIIEHGFLNKQPKVSTV